MPYQKRETTPGRVYNIGRENHLHEDGSPVILKHNQVLVVCPPLGEYTEDRVVSPTNLSFREKLTQAQARKLVMNHAGEHFSYEPPMEVVGIGKNKEVKRIVELPVKTAKAPDVDKKEESSEKDGEEENEKKSSSSSKSSKGGK